MNGNTEAELRQENDALRRQLSAFQEEARSSAERADNLDDQLAAFMRFLRAIRCAHFLGIQARILLFIIELAWLRPRLVYGQRKPVPVFIHAGKMASSLGCDKVTVYRALASLTDGLVVFRKPNGYVPNPDWKAWMDARTGQPSIMPSCYHVIEHGEDTSQGQHQCGVAPDGPDGGADATGGVAPTQLLTDRTVAPTQLVAPTQPIAPKRNAGGRAGASEENSSLSSSVTSLPNEEPSENTYISKPTDQHRAHEAGSNMDVCIHTLEDSQSKDGCEQPAVPTATSHPTAVSYTMNGELPGPFTVDADKWSIFAKLTDQFFPMQEMASTLHLHRRQFPTGYFVKIAKRCIISRKPGKSFTPAYMLSVMRAWAKNPDGPDRGPEDDYADDMNMIATPTIPFEQRMPDAGADAAELEPSRIDPANKAWLMAAMKERMRKHVL